MTRRLWPLRREGDWIGPREGTDKTRSLVGSSVFEQKKIQQLEYLQPKYYTSLTKEACLVLFHPGPLHRQWQAPASSKQLRWPGSLPFENVGSKCTAASSTPWLLGTEARCSVRSVLRTWVNTFQRKLMQQYLKINHHTVLMKELKCRHTSVKV